MNRNKHATHEYISFFNPWTETSTLDINISRSFIHKPKQACFSWINISFFNPWTETSTLLMNIFRSYYTWIYLVLLSTNRNKHATHNYISFFNPWTETSTLLMNIFRSYYTWIYFVLYPWAETSTLHMNISRSLIHEPKQARYLTMFIQLKYENRL